MNTAEINCDQTIDLADFKARCLEVLEQLATSGLIVTKEGRPFAQITPLTTVNNEQLIGSMKGQIAIHGDIFSTASWTRTNGNWSFSHRWQSPALCCGSLPSWFNLGASRSI